MTKFWFNKMDDPIQPVDERSFSEQFAEIMELEELPIVSEENGGYKGISSKGNCWLYIDEYDETFLTDEDASLNDLQIEVITGVRESAADEEVRMHRAKAINAMLEIFRDPHALTLQKFF